MLAPVLEAHCRQAWPDWFGHAARSRLDIFFVPSRAQSSERAVALVFLEKRLRAVLKLTQGDQRWLSLEQQALERVQGIPELASRTPRVLGTGCHEVALPMSAGPRGSTLWLLALAAVGGRIWRPPPPQRALSDRGFARVERVLRDLDGLMAGLPRDGGELGPVPSLEPSWQRGLRTLGLARKHQVMLHQHYGHERERPPPVQRWSHGDLAPGNVRVVRGQVRAVVDWEMASSAYEPWFDRLYPALLAMRGALAGGHRPPESSWPVRWLHVLDHESDGVPMRVRGLRVVGELADRAVQLGRGSPQRWAPLADFLADSSDGSV